MKAIIVEDESVIRNGLATGVPWVQLGVEEIKLAENADTALKICKMFQPEIVISDICMPGMDGVEMCRKIREYNPNAQLIFVTGHAEKEYLKAAIDLHVIRFVEKPIQTTEINKAVSKAVEEVKKSKNYLTTLLYTLLKNSEKLDYTVSGHLIYAVLIFEFKSEDKEVHKNNLLERFNVLASGRGGMVWGDVLDTGEIAFIVSGNRAIAEDKWMQGEIHCLFNDYLREMRVDGFLAVGKDVHGQERVTESYQSAKKALSCLSFLDWNCCATEEDYPGEVRVNFFQDYSLFREMVARKEIAKAQELLRTIHESLLNNKTVIDNEIRLIYFNLNQIIDNVHSAYGGVEERMSAVESGDTDKIHHLKTLRELHEYLNRKLLLIGVQENDDKSNLVIQKVKDYIHAHYEDSGLSIKILADHVSLTPTYLSNLFKKYTDRTVGQYMLEVRMEAAKRMLKDPQYKLYQISFLVGYEDANYFTKIFKKEIGMTPSEYRNKTVI